MVGRWSVIAVLCALATAGCASEVGVEGGLEGGETGSQALSTEGGRGCVARLKPVAGVAGNVITGFDKNSGEPIYLYMDNLAAQGQVQCKRLARSAKAQRRAFELDGVCLAEGNSPNAYRAHFSSDVECTIE